MRALVLSGGGCKGAYQVGALKKWMCEDGIDYDIVAGISVGALNASIISQTPVGQPKVAWDSLKQNWDRVSNSHIKKSWFPLGVVESIWKPSVYNSEPLNKWIRSGLDQKKIVSSGRKLRVVAVSLDTGESRVSDETTQNIQEWVCASAAFPVMLTPINIEGQSWVDGGLRSITPLGEAIRAGADEIDIILCSNPDLIPPYRSVGHSAIPGYLERSLDILTNQILRADLKVCNLKNIISGKGNGHRFIKLRVLQPDVPELTHDSLDFSPKLIQSMMNMGYEGACKLV